MKKIWIINSVRWNSAISEYALNLARALDKYYDVTMTLKAHKAPAKRAKSFGLKCSNLNSFGASSILKIKKLEYLVDPDIVICFSGQESFLCRFLSKGRFLIRFMGRDDDVGRSIRPSLFNSYIDHYLFPCDFIARSSSISNASMIYLGCDNEKYRPISPSKLDRPTLLILGRLDLIKGHNEFLHFFAEYLKYSSLEIKPLLKIIGNDANLNASDIQLIVDNLGLQNDVEIINEYIVDIERHIASATVGVISSIGSEVICRVGEEFLLSGVPIFVTDVGSLSECLFFKGSGEKYAYDNYKEGFKKLETLIDEVSRETLEDKEERSMIAHKRFSFNAMRDSFNELVQAIF